MNTIALAGYVITDPEIKQVGDTRVARFRVAVRFAGPKKDGGGREDGIWTVEAWGKQADFVEKHIKNQSAVTVTGELRLDRWEKDGQKRETTYVEAYRVGFPPVSRDKPGRGESGAAPDEGGSPSSGGSSSGGGNGSGKDYDPYDV